MILGQFCIMVVIAYLQVVTLFWVGGVDCHVEVVPPKLLVLVLFSGLQIDHNLDLKVGEKNARKSFLIRFASGDHPTFLIELNYQKYEPNR